MLYFIILGYNGRRVFMDLWHLSINLFYSCSYTVSFTLIFNIEIMNFCSCLRIWFPFTSDKITCLLTWRIKNPQNQRHGRLYVSVIVNSLDSADDKSKNNGFQKIRLISKYQILYSKQPYGISEIIWKF